MTRILSIVAIILASTIAFTSPTLALTGSQADFCAAAKADPGPAYDGYCAQIGSLASLSTQSPAGGRSCTKTPVVVDVNNDGKFDAADPTLNVCL